MTTTTTVTTTTSTGTTATTTTTTTSVSKWIRRGKTSRAFQAVRMTANAFVSPNEFLYLVLFGLYAHRRTSF